MWRGDASRAEILTNGEQIELEMDETWDMIERYRESNKENGSVFRRVKVRVGGASIRER